MQDIGPDMEELFRRASEDYPLKLGEDKWSEISSKINDKPISQPDKKQPNRYRKYYAVLLFLLLFLSLQLFLPHQFYNQNADFQKSPKNEIRQVNQPKKLNKAIRYKISEKTSSATISTVSRNILNVVNSPLNKTIEQQFRSMIAGTQSEKIKILQSVNQPINLTNDVEMNKVLDRSFPPVIKIKDINSIHASNNSLSNINSADTVSRAEQFNSSLSNSAEKKVMSKTSMHRFYYGVL